MLCTNFTKAHSMFVKTMATKPFLILTDWHSWTGSVCRTPVGHPVVRGEHVGGPAVVLVEVLNEGDHLRYARVHQPNVLLVLPGTSDTRHKTQKQTTTTWRSNDSWSSYRTTWDVLLEISSKYHEYDRHGCFFMEVFILFYFIRLVNRNARKQLYSYLQVPHWYIAASPSTNVLFVSRFG